MNKLIGFIFIIIFLLLIVYPGYSIYQDLSIDKDCLEDIAEDNCIDNDLYYSGIGYRSIWIYWCPEYKNEMSDRFFRFTDKELERCKDE